MKTRKCLLIILEISLLILKVHASGQCNDEQYECLSGKCIPREYLCNKVDDCEDQDDENQKWCGEELQSNLSN